MHKTSNGCFPFFSVSYFGYPEAPLANHKSAMKRHKQSIKRAARNRAAKTRMKNAVKAVRVAVHDHDREQAVSALSAAKSVLDKNAGKAVHWKNTARRVSRLAKAVNSIMT